MDQGNTVIVIEHNLDVIKTADWIVDLGPEGGERGGTVIAEGTPEEVAATPASYTGAVLAPVLDRGGHRPERLGPASRRRAPASPVKRRAAAAGTVAAKRTKAPGRTPAAKRRKAG